MKALIIADSPDFDAAFIQEHAHTFDLVIVTDGAIHKVPTEAPVSVVCGDFDSIDLETVRETHPKTEILHLPDQNSNDLEKAIVLALERGTEEICLACSLGGLIDQSTANLSVMIKYHYQINLRARHRGTDLWVISSDSPHNNPLRIAAAQGDTLSIIPLLRSAVLSVSNVKWPLTRDEVSLGSQGVSNKALGGDIDITIERGLVVVFHRSV